MPSFDRETFNNDPKHEQARNQFDQMVEDSLNRIGERKKKEKGNEEPKQKGFLEEFLDGFLNMGK